MKTVRVRIRGIVQGVGFRPFVYNLALKHGLRGFCLNDSEGVVIEAQGAGMERFIDELKDSAPPLARIDGLALEELSGAAPFKDFTIRESLGVDGRFALVSPDVATCEDCLRELFDPGNRRYLYPFINCTNCGPRYSIVLGTPYDRGATTMAKFRLCKECEREYRDPSDRRFHAQPNACPACGPRVWLSEGMDERRVEEGHQAISKAMELLNEGAVLAVKGLGGFHLVCDAANDKAVERLRAKKRKSLSRGLRSNKPFAVMARDTEAVEAFARVSEDERRLLEGRVRPIVLLEKSGGGVLSRHVAPNNAYYGVMLPYTPLHHLLLGPPPLFKALVMTSGNIADEPIVISNAEALRKLSSIADYLLLHDRDVYMRVDDSIVGAGGRRVIRRARGYAPFPIGVDRDIDGILAFGALLKNTFCLTKGKNAILSQHIGDLENYESLEFFKESLRNLKKTFRSNPSIVAHDMHPDYLSTRLAIEYAREEGIPDERVVPVQHHHAHIASVMAEHGLRERVIGVAFDGTGYGEDGNIWGGEFLIADRSSFKRAAHLAWMALPGGDAGVREPWRMALSCLYMTFGKGLRQEAHAFLERLDGKETDTVLLMIERGINSPLTSSAGRLFDAVSSIIGLRDVATFEAEAAIELEAIADKGYASASPPYPFTISGDPVIEIDFRPMVKEILRDLKAGEAKAAISGRFHSTLAEAVLKTVKSLSAGSGIKDVALSGGVFQNRLLSAVTEERLRGSGFRVFTNSRVPPNDGGVSLGQAVVAWERAGAGRG